jgi:hypothetical protein
MTYNFRFGRVGAFTGISRMLLLVSESPLIWHRDPGDHGEMALVEGYELGAVLFGSCGDQGVRDIGAVCFHWWKPPRYALLSMDGRNAQILADLIGQDVADLGVARDGRPTALVRVVPPGVVATLSKKIAAVTTQVAQ